MKSYAFGGDFEGHLAYGLASQVAPNTDQVLAIRAGRTEEADGPHMLGRSRVHRRRGWWLLGKGRQRVLGCVEDREVALAGMDLKLSARYQVPSGSL